MTRIVHLQRWKVIVSEGAAVYSCSTLPLTITTDSSLAFAYSADGQRISKTVGSTTYQYHYDGSQLVEMTWGSNKMHFTYDLLGPATVTYNGTVYYYLRNAQGDVIGIANSSGTQVVAYRYDAWGNILDISGSMADTLGQENPFRYRGYVYDSETGLYYLTTRYYNPGTGRFINADGYVATGQGLSGNNMFAYCNNNPVNRVDEEGKLFGIIIGGIVGAIAGGISAAVKGESIFYGALIGGLVGVATGFVGALGATTVVKIVAGAAFSAAGETANQYANYRLQEQVKAQNEKNGVKTTSGTPQYGQSQAVADRAYNANSFKEYVNVDDIATSALLGGFGEGLSWGASKIIPAADLIELPKADFFPALLRDVLVEVDINIIQFFFDYDYSPNLE